ncbi:MAG: nuclear transport factor 2 family protein [Muribaculaceae bacterium]|nr:nuclear transport factor 2 family protein [Bacteroides sp.]MDE6681420.1 nuclear transport factor 2 family protein [Muribaculaceae bacterium]
MSTIENTCDSTKCCNATAEEIAGIRKALDLYCEASVKGNSKIAEPAFAPTATISYVENGKLVSVPIKALFDYYDQTGVQPASYKITSCDVATDIAIVSIDSKFGETCFADMFTLVKDGEDWKIISKVYRVK